VSAAPTALRSVIVINIKSSTYGKPPPTAIWQLNYLHPLAEKELLLVEEAKRYHSDVIEVSSTKRRGSGTVNMNSGWKQFYSRADLNVSAKSNMGKLTSSQLSDDMPDWIHLGSRVCIMK